MGWLSRYRKQDSAALQLSQLVFQVSVECANTLKLDLEEKFGQDSSEFCIKYLAVMFEFMYFFLHATDRIAFAELAGEKREKLIDEVVVSAVDRMIAAYFNHAPLELKNSVKSDFTRNYNNAQANYGSCEEIFLNPEGDTRTFDKIKSGMKSKSVVGRLIDNLSEQIEGQVNVNALFTMRIWGLAVEGLNVGKLKQLIACFSR